MHRFENFSSQQEPSRQEGRRHELVAFDEALRAARSAVEPHIPNIEEKVFDAIYKDNEFFQLHQQLERAHSVAPEIPGEEEAERLLQALPVVELQNILSKAEQFAEVGRKDDAKQWLGEFESRKDWWSEITTFGPDSLNELGKRLAGLKAELAK